MAWKMLLAALLLLRVSGSTNDLQQQNSHDCHMQIQCNDRSEQMPLVIRGFPGLPGATGNPGPCGPPGRQGLAGPPGRDGYLERSVSFYAELPRLFMTINQTDTLRPWKLTPALNAPDTSKHFSAATGIFTAPVTGLYYFTLTVAVSRTQALVYIAKNGKHQCFIRLSAIGIEHNITAAWGWTSGSTDCLVHCRVGDQISVVGSNEYFDSHIYGYSYSTFSGYVLHTN